MSFLGFTPRTLITEASFDQDYAATAAAVPRLEDIWLGLSWRIARHPEGGQKLGNTGFYLMKSNPGIDPNIAPQIIVLYEFDANNVTFHAIGIAPQVP